MFSLREHTPIKDALEEFILVAWSSDYYDYRKYPMFYFTTGFN